jgi:glutamyl-tRNA(Gln) amidotransferase subunit E
MYPETDVLPVRITREYWDSIPVPELLDSRAARFASEFGLDPALARQVAYSENLPLFEEAVRRGVPPPLAARTLLATVKEISRDGLDTDVLFEPRETPGDPAILSVLLAAAEGRLAKEAVPQVLRSVCQGTGVSQAIEAMESRIDDAQLRAIADRLVQERIAFVREKGNSALGPLMGPMMKEVGGTVDGRKVSQVLRDAIRDALGE